MKSERGFSLVQVLVISGVVATLLLSATALIVQQQQQAKTLRTRMEGVDLAQLAQSILVDDNACGCQLTGKVFNPASGTGFSLNELKASCAPSAPAIARTPASTLTSGTVVRSLGLTEVAATGNLYEFQGNLAITLDPTGLSRPLPPAKVRVKFYVDPTSPPNARSVLGCGTSPFQAFSFWNDGAHNPTTFVLPRAYSSYRIVSLDQAFPDGAALDTSTLRPAGSTVTVWYNGCDNSSYIYTQLSGSTFSITSRTDDDCGGSFWNFNWHTGQRVLTVRFFN